jgi:putative alpha-1,2-mannosidase
MCTASVRGRPATWSGCFPRWALANTATAEMTGDSVVPLIANLYAFCAKDFEVDRALHFMLDAAKEGVVGRRGYVERPQIGTCVQRGYLPLPSPSWRGLADHPPRSA